MSPTDRAGKTASTSPKKEPGNGGLILEKLSELRNKLLDLSGRNPLLNFRHSDKAKTHVRIIDELPDFLFGELLAEKQLTFRPLPQPNNEPHDEKNEKFQSAFRQAALTDEDYLKSVEALSNKEDAFDDLAKLERELKNKVRVVLGMPLLKDLQPLSNAEWAKQHGLVPQYDQPLPKAGPQAKKHQDKWMQTLLLPKEHQQKLAGLKRNIKMDINETGVNTFFAAFGFLEWYDREDAEKPYFAPLVLLQLSEVVEKKSGDGQIQYSIEASGEAPQYNLPLAERLKTFNLVLPEFDESDTPESYMAKVTRMVKVKPKWRVRRFITIGRFQFARLVMYHDLDPKQWPSTLSISLPTNPLIKTLLSGYREDEGGDGSQNAPVYEIDTSKDIPDFAPILITDADSSQHSAIVDAMKNKNLVIKGPPGTGKSQTITNLIANAIAKGQKVLFVAEKMAALDVVYSRLKRAGLGDFCLELHSTKTKLKDIRENLTQSIENRRTRTRPQDLDEQIKRAKEARDNLRAYSDALNSSIGGAGKTVFDVIWTEQSRRSIISNLPPAVKKVRVPEAETLTESQISQFSDELDQARILILENKGYENTRHPWQGVGLSEVNSLQISEIIQSVEDAHATFLNLESELSQYAASNSWRIGDDLGLLKRNLQSLREIALAPVNANELNYEIIGKISNHQSLSKAQRLAQSLNEYDQAVAAAGKVVRGVEKVAEQKDEILALCAKAKHLGISEMKPQKIDEHVEQCKLEEIEWKDLYSKSTPAIKRILKKESGTIREVVQILEGVKLLRGVERKALLLRNDQTLQEANSSIIASAIEKQAKFNKLKSALGELLDLSYPLTEDDHSLMLYEFSNFGIFSHFRGSFYKAKKVYKALSRRSGKISYVQAANELRELKAYKTEFDSLTTDNRYRELCGKHYEGVETDYRAMSKVCEWAQVVHRILPSNDDVSGFIKQFLFSADISDVDALIEQFSEIDLDRAIALLNKISSPEMAFSQFIAKVAETIQEGTKVSTILRQITVSVEHTYGDVEQCCRTLIAKIAAIKSDVEANGEYAALFDGIFTGIKTSRSSLQSNCKFSGLIVESDLPNEIKDRFCNDKGFEAARSLHSNAQRIGEISEKLCGQLKFFAKKAELDETAYYGGISLEGAPFANIRNNLSSSLADTVSLGRLVKQREFFATARTKPYAEFLKALSDEKILPERLGQIFVYLMHRTLCDRAFRDYKILEDRSILSLSQIREKYQELDKKIIQMQATELRYQLQGTQPAKGINHGYVSDYTEMGLIRHQIQGRARSIPLRKFLKRAGNAMQALKPCFLMSPLSVAQYIEPEGIKFDIVVIDEASQMCPEEALGAIARSGRMVIVGDPQQLPPTSFFQKQTVSGAAEDDYESEDELNNESILDMALSRYYPPRELLWHYRSRHESLISFSNARFYRGRLIVFPSPENTSGNFGVSTQYVGGLYSASCNVDEARAVVEAARKFMREYPHRSLGIATMNSQQRDLIEEQMYRLFLDDTQAEGYRIKWESTLEPFFVKNLESVQGDERDSIFVSTIYGPAAPGAKPAQRFGPINGKHGHRRLNVLFTRAKHNLVLFTSLKPDQIIADEKSTDGLKTFKAYLEYATTGRLAPGDFVGNDVDNEEFEGWVKSRLEAKGYGVVPQIGVQGYFIDLGIRHPKYPYGFLVGVECDGSAYHSCKSSRDRDRIRQEVLEGLGWTIYRVWSTNWFHDPDKELNKLVEFIEATFANKSAERAEKENSRLSIISEIAENAKVDLFNRIDEEAGAQAPNPASPAPPLNDQVSVSDTVTIKFLDNDKDEKMTVTIVATQSSVDLGHINQHSAIGRALMGCKKGEEIEIALPRGTRPALIVEIMKAG